MKPLTEYFETRYRPAIQTTDERQTDGTATGQPFVCLTDDAPDWLREAVFEAHEGELPNDWRYETCQRIIRELSDRSMTNGDLADPDTGFEIADFLTDVYTADLVAWLAGHIDRPGVCDEAAAERGLTDDTEAANGIVSRIALGQFVTIERMARILIDAVAANTDDEADPDDCPPHGIERP